MLISRLNFKRILTSVLVIAAFSGYNSVYAETTEAKGHDAHHAQKAVDWPGIYNGFLPCADCIGLKTSLALNKNNTYILITQYVGKSPKDHVEKGKYSVDEKSNTIVLTSRDGSTTQQYSLGENMLIQLDSKGNRLTGKNADSYILRRTDITSNPPSHAGH